MKPLPVVVVTHNRTATCCACLKSLLDNLVYPDIRWIISDDRSEPGHVETVLGFMEASGFDMDKVTLRRTNQFHWGLGAAMNNGLSAAYDLSDVALRTEDDWFLPNRLDMSEYVSILGNDEVCGIRLGYSDEHMSECEWANMLRVHGDNRHVYVFNNQVMAVHQRSFSAIGRYDENIDSRRVEDLVAERYNRYADFGNKRPYVLIDRRTEPFQLNNGPFFVHVGGVSTLTHDYRNVPQWIAEKIDRVGESIRKSAPKPSIHICMIGDSKYSSKMAVTIKSLSERSCGSNITAHVIVPDGLGREDANILKKASNGIKLGVIKPEERVIDLCRSMDPTRKRKGKMHNASCSMSLVPLSLRFLIPRLVPLSKVLYVDGDVVFRKSPIELYFTDVTDFRVAVVQDAWNVSSRRNARRKYINSGVILYNLDRWRDENVDYMCCASASGSGFVFPYDQNIINAYVKDNMLLLSPEFNMQIDYIASKIKSCPGMLDSFNRIYDSRYGSIDEMVDTCTCLHYCTARKPWNSNCERADIWHYYNDMLK